MRIKDYYKILEVAPDATEKEIKKSYRQLAMKLHPDKNNGNQLAENHFKEVAEAYQILSDPGRRSAYNQQRWYRQSIPKSDNLPVTPHQILQKCKALNRYMNTLDAFHINPKTLNQYILRLLSEPSLKLLIHENNISTNRMIIDEVLKSLYPLPVTATEKIGTLLTRLAAPDSEQIENIQRYIRLKKNTAYWDKYLPLMILVITVLLCFVIYIVGKRQS